MAVRAKTKSIALTHGKGTISCNLLLPLWQSPIGNREAVINTVCNLRGEKIVDDNVGEWVRILKRRSKICEYFVVESPLADDPYRARHTMART